MPIHFRPLPEVSDGDKARFWASVDIRGPDECWPWLAGTNPKRGNYGRFWIHRVEYRTNRMAFWLHYGIDPSQDDACHTCDNPPCCNPAHLFKGTRAQNLADMVAKGRSGKGDRHFSRLYPERVARGDRLPQTKLTPEQVRTIREAYAIGGISQYSLAQRYSVGQQVIWSILHRKTWKHVA